MKKDNITINLSSIVDYIRDKDILIDALRLKLDKQKEALEEADKGVEYWKKECDKRSNVLEKIKIYLVTTKRDNFDFSKSKILEMIEETK